MQVRCERRFREATALPELERQRVLRSLEVAGVARCEPEKISPREYSVFCYNVLLARRGRAWWGLLKLPPLPPTAPSS